MDSYYSCNTVLEGVKASSLVGIRESTLRNIHIQMGNYKHHNSGSMIEELDEIRVIRWDHQPYSRDIAPSDFWFFGCSKREMKGRIFSGREGVKTF
jgi:hypothetical protein